MELGHSFWIEVAHLLPDPFGVERMHGHSYQITVYIKTDPDKPTPLKTLSEFCDFIKSDIDHRYINEVISEPTMENLAVWIYKNIQGPRPTRITVSRPSIGATLNYYPNEE